MQTKIFSITDEMFVFSAIVMKIWHISGDFFNILFKTYTWKLNILCQITLWHIQYVYSLLS